MQAVHRYRWFLSKVDRRLFNGSVIVGVFDRKPRCRIWFLNLWATLCDRPYFFVADYKRERRQKIVRDAYYP